MNWGDSDLSRLKKIHGSSQEVNFSATSARHMSNNHMSMSTKPAPWRWALLRRTLQHPTCGRALLRARWAFHVWALNSFWLQQQNLTITIIPTDSTLWNETSTEIELASCESKASNFNKGNMTGQLVPMRRAPVTEWQQPQKNTLDETDSPFKLNQVQDRAAPRSKWRPIPAYPHTSCHTVGRRSPEHGIWLQRKNEGYEMEIHGLLEQICKSEELSWKFSKTRLENYKSSRLRTEQWLPTKKLHANAQWLESQEIPNNASKSPLVRMDGQNSRK